MHLFINAKKRSDPQLANELPLKVNYLLFLPSGKTTSSATLPHRLLVQLLVAFAIYSLMIVGTFGRRNSGKRCVSCDTRVFEDYKQLRQQQILNELLKKLELPSKPNVTIDYDNLPPIGQNNSKVQALIEQTLRERRRRVKKSPFQSPSENIPGVNYFPALYESNPEVVPQTSFVLAESFLSFNNQEYGESVVFNLSPTLQKKYVSKVLLNVIVRHPVAGSRLQEPITINVYSKFGNRIATKFDSISREQTVVQVPLDPVDIEELQQQELQQSNLQDGSQDIGSFSLIIEIHDNDGKILNMQDPTKKSSTFIELETYDSHSGRSRRSNLCRANLNQTGCCLYDLVIDFEKVGWEFVIAPKRYNAYICSGDCDPVQMSKSALGRVAMQANVDHFLCCHPKEYSGITIVYVDNADQIWIREVPNMVAKKCSCT